jgi:hypothetical protein
MSEGIWTIIGAIASLLVLALVVWEIVLYPIIRRQRLKRPCRAHFVIRDLARVPLPYVVQDDQTHIVRELVLPSNSMSEIEIGYEPRIPFREVALVFACEGDESARPYAKERFSRFTRIGKNHWMPGADPTDVVDVHNYYHVKRDVPRNTGSHFVTGFKLQTRAAGVYPVVVTFFTDEIEGKVKLAIRVEDKPKTLMRCLEKGHHGCFVRPRIEPTP